MACAASDLAILFEHPAPVVELTPDPATPAPQCWAVALGNTHHPLDRTLTAGYSNGDIIMTDLRNNAVSWRTNLGLGICSLELDCNSIPMNKLVAATLEGQMHAFDLRTFNAESGYASVKHSVNTSTLWNVRHSPHDREKWVACSGDGGLSLYRYSYPASRTKKGKDGGEEGVMGSIVEIGKSKVSDMPIVNFDWCADKNGLGAFIALDQTLRLLVVPNFQTY